MSDNKHNDKNRRWFLSLLLSGNDNDTTNQNKPEMVKMLTANGKIVEVEKAKLDEAKKNQRSTNKEIYDWMNNPSKENNP